jgi:hypothetical protein
LRSGRFELIISFNHHVVSRVQLQISLTFHYHQLPHEHGRCLWLASSVSRPTSNELEGLPRGRGLSYSARALQQSQDGRQPSQDDRQPPAHRELILKSLRWQNFEGEDPGFLLSSVFTSV